MKSRAIVVAFALAFPGAGQALAHGDHDHEPTSTLSEDGLKARATAELNRLVSVKKIDPSWKAVAVKAIEQKGSEWLVTFENPKAKKDKKVLYVFLKPSGEVVAANFTGK